MTREAVREAARRRFSADGYSQTTIRAIARDAGVDAALVIQFFGSKDELFGEVMSLSPDLLAQILDAFQATPDAIGERLARVLLAGADDGSPDSEALLAMLRGATANPHAAAQLREFIEARIGRDAASTTLSTEDRDTRIALAASMVLGIMMSRNIVGVKALAKESTEDLVQRLAPALQAVLTP